MSEPITPKQASRARAPIPAAVFEVFNELIAKGAGIRPVTFKQDLVVAKLKERGFTSEELFSNHWLDVEALYEAAGWRVEYDKPGYNEPGDATFTFAPRSKAVGR